MSLHADRARLEAHLAADEDDAVTRLVLADLLEEMGDEEEAARQRKWTAAKAWLVEFCAGNNADPAVPDPYEWRIDYDSLVDAAWDAASTFAKGDDRANIHCGSNETMMHSLQQQKAEFWRRWSVVTGVPLPDGLVESVGYSCSC